MLKLHCEKVSKGNIYKDIGKASSKKLTKDEHFPGTVSHVDSSTTPKPEDTREVTAGPGEKL